MTNKNIIVLTVIGLVVIIFGIYLFNQPKSLQESENTALLNNQKTQGKIVFGITDATKDITGVTSVIVTVNKVDIHNAVGGWITVSTVTKEYDLLALKKTGTVSLLVNTNVDAGTYDQVRLMISKVMVTKNGVEQEAKLPSGELKIIGNIVVKGDKTSSIVFDFLADKSLHLTGNGKFIFAPVLKVTKRGDVEVELKSNNELEIKDGDKEDDEDSEDIGMDSKGEVKVNFELKGNLNIDINGEIQGEIDD